MKEITQDNWLSAAVRTAEAAEHYEKKTRDTLERLAVMYLWRGIAGGTATPPQDEDAGLAPLGGAYEPRDLPLPRDTIRRAIEAAPGSRPEGTGSADSGNETATAHRSEAVAGVVDMPLKGSAEGISAPSPE